MYTHLKLFLIITALSLATLLHAQPQGVDPELKTLYEEANQAIGEKNYDKAISAYFQAIRIQPNNIVLRRDLAYTYYLAGRYKNGLDVINPIVESGAADEETYQVAAALENANGNSRKANRVLDNGLKRYPNSGLLYNAKGISRQATDKNGALNLFLDGIQASPNYAMNYLSAAKVLLEKNEVIWAIIYAETFVNIEPQSMRTLEGKRLLVDAYNKLFSVQDNASLPDFSKTDSRKKKDFGQAVKDVYANNYIVMTDGVTTENLTMLRTRFLLQWVYEYPLSAHSLFQYQDYLLKQGHFDAYNQFLFGSVADSRSYSLWVKNNADAYTGYGKWVLRNAYKPSPSDPQYSK